MLVTEDEGEPTAKEPPLIHRIKLAYRRAADIRRDRLEHDRLMQDPRTAVEHDLALRGGDGRCPYCN
jgi:hypothetical protein